MENILQNNSNKKIILLGNEAIVRGALESGVNFVSTYPGTPASEIGNTFYNIVRKNVDMSSSLGRHKIAKDAGVYFEQGEKQGSEKRSFEGPYFEFSTNEKVALEAGIGASFSGLKTLVAMKNFGLNVCLDALIPFVYTGTKGPTVIIVADDPSCHSSAQSEENTRPIENLVHIPILEPSDPQECLDFTKLAFQISEKFKIPVMIRTTTRVAHQRMPVKIGEYELGIKNEGKFIKDVKRWVTLPPRVLEMKKELFEKIEKIREFSEKTKINKIEGDKKSKIGIITSAISYLYVKEILKDLNLNLPILKLGVFYPSPNKKTKNFIRKLKKVLIVEELEASLEQWARGLAKDVNPKLQIFGKNLLPVVGELRPEIVASAIAKIANKKLETETKSKISVPKRFPQFCPGCPYWLVFNAIKKAVNPTEVVFGGDIGCYMLFGNPAVNMQDYLSCMGSSIGIAHGIKKATGQKLITFIGDSTFFHAGIPALINTVFNKSNPLIIILNNETTAMTGHQPHPAALGVAEPIEIEKVVSACGVKNLKTIDPINQEEFSQAVKDFLAKDEVSVIIAKRICIQIKK